MREALARYTVELKKFVLQNIEEIISAFQRERILSEEIDLKMEKERHLDAWKYIDVNIDLFVSIIKMNLRGAKKDGVMFTYVNDYLAPHPWLGEEMNKFNIAIRAMTEVVKRIEKEDPSLYKHLQEQDAHICIYEELEILEKWNLDKKAFMDSQKRGIDLIRTDPRLRDLVEAYFAVGVVLRI